MWWFNELGQRLHLKCGSEGRWVIVAERPARKGWDTPSRPREDRGVDGIPRTLWEGAS